MGPIVSMFFLHWILAITRLSILDNEGPEGVEMCKVFRVKKEGRLSVMSWAGSSGIESFLTD